MSKKRPAVFFDRDNTLIVSEGYLGDPSQVRLIDGAADAIARVRGLGFAVVVVSNQSGVARGFFTEDDVRAVNGRMDELLRSHHPDAIIDLHEFCPFHPDAKIEHYRRDSDLRKPRPGMLYAAAQKLDLDLSASWMIGDAPRDIEAGQAAGCRTILFQDKSLSASVAATEPPTVAPDAVVGSLAEAVALIEASANRSPMEQAPVDASGEQHVVTTPPPVQTPPPSPSPSQPPARAEASTLPAAGVSVDPQQRLLEQLVLEIRQIKDQHAPVDFSLSKLLAGIVQVLALAVVFWSYFQRETDNFSAILLVGIYLQLLTIALLIMGRQR